MENMLRGSLTSTTDAKGVLGFKGERGYSAYEIAVLHGYEGTEQDWIDHFGLDLSNYVQTSDVVDSTTSTSTSYPLSANQGKNLKDDIGDLTDLQTSATTDLVSAINSVVESGSNTNGSYIKYADGTMICTKKVTGRADINIEWGSGYTTGASASISFGSWPQTFVETPVVNITTQRSGSNSWLTGLDNISTTYAGAVSLCRFTVGLDVPYTIHVIGIGKWK